MSPDEKQRILVVDDEVLIARTLSLILERNGFDSAAASSGEQALTLLDTFRPDILITDVVMPGMGGRELAALVAKRYPACRIFMLTGHAHHIDFTDLIEHGVKFEVIAKPAHPVELLRQLSLRSVLTFQIRPTALIVDDFEPHRYSVTRLLRQSGFDVLEASSGEECMEKVAASPHVIVLDIHLPDVNGFDVCRKLRASPRTANTPIVHLTSTAKSAEAREESRLVGANEYFTSPFDPDDLVVRLRSLVQHHLLTVGP